MIHFVLSGENLPFTVSLVLMLAIGVLEVIFSLFGPGLSHLIEMGLPGFDHDISLHGPHLDHDLHDLPHGHVEDAGAFSRLLGWLRVGEVPLLMLLVVFLTAFGIIGLGIQFFMINLFKTLLPGPLAAGGALALAIPCVRIGGGWLRIILPKDETTAVSEDTFIGKIAVVTGGEARRSRPAEARLQDQHKQSHYILIEPDDDTEAFPVGTVVLILKRENTIFRAIRNPNSALVD